MGMGRGSKSVAHKLSGSAAYAPVNPNLQGVLYPFQQPRLQGQALREGCHFASCRLKGHTPNRSQARPIVPLPHAVTGVHLA